MTYLTELKRPNRPQSPPTSEGGSTQTPTSEQKALAVSTAAAHGMRASLNSQIGHVAGLQDAFIEAATPVVDEASDFFAMAMSGELLWGEIEAQTKAKMAQLPKPQAVELKVKPLPKPSFKHSTGRPNRFMRSSATAFLPEQST